MLPCRAFCLVILGFSCILVGDWGAEIAFDAADVSEFGGLLGAWAVTAVLLTLGPLVLVSPRLLEARLRGLREFGALATSYTRLFEERWIRRVPDRPLLGTPDLQSLADLGNSFRVVREMRVILVRKRDVLLVLLASVGPALPFSAHEISSGGAARTALSDRREVGARVRLLTWKRSRPGGVLSFS